MRLEYCICVSVVTAVHVEHVGRDDRDQVIFVLTVDRRTFFSILSSAFSQNESALLQFGGGLAGLVQIPTHQIRA